MAVLAPFPTFLIIGLRRNATRWLRFNLDAHPEICAPPLALDFFTDAERMSRLGLRWYREQFREWDGEAILGEASWSYVAWNSRPAEVADRIGRLLPEVRLVVIIGNPLDRFQSRLRQLVRRGELPTDLDVDRIHHLEDHSDLATELVIEGLQSSTLQPYLSRFGDQLHVVELDEIRADPVAAYQGVLRHLGADDSFVPADLALVRYSERPAIELPEPSLEARQFLYAWYRPDVTMLEDLIGRDLSAWDPGTGASTPSNDEILSHLKAVVA